VLTAISLLATTLLFLSFCVAVRLVFVSGYPRAWGIIAGAVLLLAVHTGVHIFEAGDPKPALDVAESLTTLGIALLMLAGVLSMGPLFRSMSRAGDDLRRRQEDLDAFIESSAEFFWVTGPDLRFTFVSGGYARVTGTPPATLVGSSLADLRVFRSPDGARADEADAPPFETMLASRTPFRDLTCREALPDGRTIDLMVSGQPYFDNDGGFAGYRGASRDITQLIRTEDELRRQTAFFSSIVENIPYMIFVKEADELRFTHFNRAGEDLLGMTRDDLIGKNDYDFFPADQARFFTDKDREVLARDEPLEIAEEPIDTRSQGRRILHTKKIAVCDADGTPRYLLGISEDITGRKELDQVKSEFVSIVSHELRTPLTAIRGALGLVSGGTLGPLGTHVHRLIEIADRNCRRLIALVDDILDLEKIESGRMSYRLERLPFDATIGQAVDLNRAFGEPFDVAFDFSPDAGGAHVKGDPDRINQVVANLMSNAAKFSPSGGIVRIATTVRDGVVRVTVSDDGPGVPPEFRPHLFEKFAQADSAATRRHGGTGLGLNISRAIVESHGGRIALDPDAGPGATFFFELPRADG
jgi:PAS domain S-box-containing protein